MTGELQIVMRKKCPSVCVSKLDEQQRQGALHPVSVIQQRQITKASTPNPSLMATHGHSWNQQTYLYQDEVDPIPSTVSRTAQDSPIRSRKSENHFAADMTDSQPMGWARAAGRQSLRKDSVTAGCLICKTTVLRSQSPIQRHWPGGSETQLHGEACFQKLLYPLDSKLFTSTSSHITLIIYVRK